MFNGIKTIKGLGVYIDVFPLDSIPEDEKRRKRFFFIMKCLNDLRGLSLMDKYIPASHRMREPIKILLYAVANLFGTNLWVKLMTSYAHKYDYLQTSLCATTMMFPIPLQKEWFSSAIEVEFEGHILPAPIGTGEYLTQQYGDYMTPPPPEKRVGHHDFVAYWKD